MTGTHDPSVLLAALRTIIDTADVVKGKPSQHGFNAIISLAEQAITAFEAEQKGTPSSIGRRLRELAAAIHSDNGIWQHGEALFQAGDHLDEAHKVVKSLMQFVPYEKSEQPHFPNWIVEVRNRARDFLAGHLEAPVPSSEPGAEQKEVAEHIAKLNPCDFGKLTDMLENPPEPTAALIELMQRPPSSEPDRNSATLNRVTLSRKCVELLRQAIADCDGELAAALAPEPTSPEPDDFASAERIGWRDLAADEAVADALAHSAQADGGIDRALAADAARRLRALAAPQMVTETHTEGPAGGPYKTTTFTRPAEPRDDPWLNPDKAAPPVLSAEDEALINYGKGVLDDWRNNHYSEHNYLMSNNSTLHQFIERAVVALSHQPDRDAVIEIAAQAIDKIEEIPIYIDGTFIPFERRSGHREALKLAAATVRALKSSPASQPQESKP